MASPASYGSLSFREQNEFLRRKLPSVDYFAVRGAAHDHSFVVAGAHRADMVADIQQVLQSALDNGDTLEAFREDFAAVLDNYGWQPEGGRAWRSRVIYETNLRTSYAAGRYQQLQAVKATRPYWMYEHSDAVITPRPEHEAWHGLVIAADDPWWETHYPPNGWGCQCRVRALNERDLQRLGKDQPDQPPPQETRSINYKGDVIEVPAGIDPGWGYAPGRSALERQVQHSLGKTERLPAAPAARMAEQVLQVPAVAGALQADWQRMLDEVVADGMPRGRRMVVGSLSPSLVGALQGAGVVPLTASISVADAAILHTLRTSKGKATTAAGLPKALNPNELRQLPASLAAPQAVLLDVGSNTLIYVFAAERREAGKLAVLVNYRLKGEERTNAIRSGSLIDYADVRKDLKSGALVLLEGAL
ncbi:MAG TPA: phage minor head protein [Pseudomonas sp.]|nr:phage minor head protein [Pseudomonas sp.]